VTGAPIPVWFVALVLAAAAPWVVRALQAALERRVRRRTLDFISEALAARDAQREHSDEREQAAQSDALHRP
jgi:hypothetical protein